MTLMIGGTLITSFDDGFLGSLSDMMDDDDDILTIFQEQVYIHLCTV